MHMIETQWVTFDCYGTLIDWESGIRRFFAGIEGIAGPEQTEQALATWEEIQFAMIRGEYRPYAGIMAESLRQTLAKLGVDYRPETGAEFTRALTNWPPFPETNAALEALRAKGLRLGILSNIDDRLLAETIKQFTVAFDLLVTAEQARAYKPSDKGFRLAIERAGVAPHRITHVAFGDRYDLATARQCGMKVVFVNRQHKNVALPVDAEIPDLSWLPALVQPAPAGQPDAPHCGGSI